jgi:hypothetical protein
MFKALLKIRKDPSRRNSPVATGKPHLQPLWKDIQKVHEKVIQELLFLNSTRQDQR